MVEVEDRNGRIVQYDYIGRLLGSETWIENSATVRTITYDYRSSPMGGLSGQVSQILDTGNDYGSSADDIIHQYGYDDQGRLEFSETYIGGLSVAVETVMSYDLGDRLIGTEFSLDASPDSTYEYRDGTADHENGYVYDAAGRLASLAQTGPAVSAKRVDLAYNRASQLAAIDRYAAVTPTSPVARTSYAFDSSGRISAINHVGAAPGSTFAQLTCPLQKRPPLERESRL